MGAGQKARRLRRIGEYERGQTLIALFSDIHGNRFALQVALDDLDARAITRRYDGKLSVNVGSVGRPKDGDPPAAAVIAAGLPDALAAMLRRGR